MGPRDTNAIIFIFRLHLVSQRPDFPHFPSPGGSTGEFILRYSLLHPRILFDDTAKFDHSFHRDPHARLLHPHGQHEFGG